ncbi:tripartite tricarboxylate transporter substrate binding protein [Mesorhizobium sp. CAU 1741]|uniref:Bug family tripartite tricarboxylate transporter substrate binding protein n=1 Tax=Mesorhizobium sp. CAU 1741 TaxID=3140366 RepID=UPI00325A5696
MKTVSRRGFLAATGAAGLAITTNVSWSDTFPSKPITLVVPYPAGGGSDAIGRLVADAISAGLSQTTVVENRGGAAGSIGAGEVARSAPDGYTILVGGSAPLAANKAIQAGLAYDPQTDFSPISLIAETPLVMLGGKDVPMNSVQDVIEYAKENPGSLAIGNAGLGAKGHIAAALFAQAAGIEVTYAPYRGSAPLLADLLGGHIMLAIDTSGTYVPHVKEGSLKALGITASQRLASLPDVPTIAEQGLEGFQATLWYGCVGPAGMPEDVAQKISDAIAAWATSPEGEEKLLQRDVNPIGGSPADLATAIDNEIEAIQSLVDAGVVARQ